MTRIISSLVQAISREWGSEDVHFHAHTGRPYPCYDRTCLRPRYDAG